MCFPYPFPLYCVPTNTLAIPYPKPRSRVGSFPDCEGCATTILRLNLDGDWADQ